MTGSKNLTSDYDLTIIGLNAPNIIWKMFIYFLKKYNFTATYILDVNLYCNGMYLKYK